MLAFLDYINRIRHNRGFGVQSPSAFYFVTQVLKEKHRYYAYEDINHIASLCATHSKKECRLLFRIVNHFAPESIIVAGAAKGETLWAIMSARTNTATTIIDCNNNLHPEVQKRIGAKKEILLTGNIATLLQEQLPKSTAKKLVYIGTADDYATATNIAINAATNESIIIIDRPHASTNKRSWWEEIIKTPAATVTYDLYSMGILLFDKNRQKQHYTLIM